MSPTETTARETAVARSRAEHLASECPTIVYALRVEDGAFAVAWISENVERLLGYTIEQCLAPQWWADHIHPEDRAAVVSALTGDLAGGLVQEYRFGSGDGTYVWLRDEKRARRGEEGRADEIVGSWSDITVRKGAERRLAESEDEYRLLFDVNPHPIWVFDVETLAFLAVNDAAVRLYGFSRDEFLGMTIKDIRPPEEVPILLEYMATIPQVPSLPAYLVKHRRKDGTLIEVAGLSNPIRFRGRPARIVLAYDVSEKKRLEAQLLQAQKMEVVGRLAGGVAHDFNNLLGVITGASELLQKTLGAQHGGARLVTEILKAAERAAELTRQLLAVGRKQVSQPHVLDLREVVAGLEPMLRRVIGENIRLVTIAGSDLGPVRADAGQVEQVLMNLVVNARDALPRGGDLVMETSNVTLDAAYARAHPEVAPGPFVMLAVRDTGEGMSAATLARMFDPFFTTKEEGKGSGLGLATVFGIVEQSGGSISVDSTVGVGTTFRIYFPRVEGEPEHPPARVPALPSPAGGEPILLVEDADSLRSMIREILEDGGYAVIEAADAEEALARASVPDLSVALMLTDVVMPRMSGPELAERVRVLRPGIKVVFMSGYAADAMGAHGVLAADIQFIGKPFTADALLAKIRAALLE